MIFSKSLMSRKMADPRMRATGRLREIVCCFRFIKHYCVISAVTLSTMSVSQTKYERFWWAISSASLIVQLSRKDGVLSGGKFCNGNYVPYNSLLRIDVADSISTFRAGDKWTWMDQSGSNTSSSNLAFSGMDRVQESGRRVEQRGYLDQFKERHSR
jgi:hypothetical protein